MTSLRGLGLLAAAFLVAFVVVGPAAKADGALGFKACEKCHEAEVNVWKKTKHFTSYKKVHKAKAAKKILKAVGEKRMKKTALCANCHYTIGGKKNKAMAGPGCESCHGNASGWVEVHNNYGPDTKREAETDAHRQERYAKSTAAGMIWPREIYDVASNCMSCHGLANENLPGDKAATMLENGHPLNPDFELVAYSQGTVRHRFYPPSIKENKEMSKAEMSVLYVVGQAAALVSATEALGKTDNAKYKAAQEKRIATAKSALAAVPEAAALVASPSHEAGRAFAAAVRGKDLTGAVGGNLPSQFK